MSFLLSIVMSFFSPQEANNTQIQNNQTIIINSDNSVDSSSTEVEKNGRWSLTGGVSS